MKQLMPHHGKRPRGLLTAAAVALAVLLLSFWQSLPYVPTQTRSFFGGGDISYLFWLFAWQLQSLATFDLHGLTNAEVFYPVPWAAAFSSQILATSLTALPLYALTQSTYWLYSFFVFLTYPLCFLGAYLYARLGEFRSVSCIVAASLFAFSAYRLNMGGYLSHISMQWIPFVFYFLSKLFSTGKTRHAYLFVLFYLLNAGASEHYFVIGNLFIVLYISLILIKKWRDHNKLPSLTQMTVPIVLAVIGVTAFYYPNLSVAIENGTQRDLREVLLYAADLEHYIGSQNTWFFPEDMERLIGFGSVLWPTLTAIILLFCGSFLLIRLRIDYKTQFRFYASLTLSFLLLILVAFMVKAWPDIDIYQARYFMEKNCLNLVHLGICLTAGAAILFFMVKGFWVLPSLPGAYFFPGVAAYLSLMALLVSLGPLIKAHGFLLAINPVAYLFYGLVPGGDAVRVLPRAFPFFSLFPEWFALLPLIFWRGNFPGCG